MGMGSSGSINVFGPSVAGQARPGRMAIIPNRTSFVPVSPLIRAVDQPGAQKFSRKIAIRRPYRAGLPSDQGVMMQAWPGGVALYAYSGE